MKNVLLAASLLATAPLAVAAPATTAPQSNHFNWNYVDVGVAVHDPDGPADELTSLGGKLSYAIDDHIYLLGGADYAWADSLDIFRLHGGLGFHTPLVERLDIFGEGELSLNRADPDGAGSDTETGFDLRAGVRFRATQQLDLKGGFYHQDIYDGDSGLYGEVTYQVNQQLGLGGMLAFGGDETVFGLYARIPF